MSDAYHVKPGKPPPTPLRMRPLLSLPARIAHDLGPLGLGLLASFREPYAENWRPLVWRGLHFANRLGLAGGVDKNGEQIEDWWRFGPGFLEVGTVTPEAQSANPGRVLFRDLEARALCNRMGFPNLGAKNLKRNLRSLPPQRTTPIFVNIGRNRTTVAENSSHDYIKVMREIDGLADAFIINISSPNTVGLRDLFTAKRFRPFLQELSKARDTHLRRKQPLLLKLSPDIESSELQDIVQIAVDEGMDGFVATNTTIARPPGSRFPKEGGVSGIPLAPKAEESLQTVRRVLQTSQQRDCLLISAGGVMSADDVARRLSLGADLVQVYSALVFYGPWFFHQVACELRD